MWGLAVNSDESIIASTSADSSVILWQDVTEQEDYELRQENENAVLNYQTLRNLIHSKDFTKALTLAITLEQPFTALKIIKGKHFPSLITIYF